MHQPNARSITRTMIALAGAAATFGASAAHAGYAVTTVANTGRGYARGCEASYNAIGTGAAFVNNAGGNGPCVSADFLSQQGATVSVTGSSDTTGKLTAAHDESSVVRLPDAAFATATADLKTGKLGLTASAVNFSGANSSAELNDTLHFTIAGATANTVTLVPVSFAFGATLPGTSNPANASAQLGYGFNFGNASAYEYGDYGAGYYGDYNNYPVFAYAAPARVSGWVSSSFASYSPLDTRFSGIYAITGATADIPIDFRLSLSAGNVAINLSNDNIAIGHVDGVSFTSDSGVFLTGNDTVGGVPEPALWAMMLGGFGIVGAVARRRRVSVAA